ncbi:hypothetical protein SCHPADRAFT_993679 [Schizopora paradoxa]|uniref:Uncharacterized protein n=1 Tax=Schizopora paradoxa TaxID=27342 RepID=A0A0H2S1N1_9AGAM|nr:hypothetical protein SCHPADRAFT_993679 [Schizopora paradoxa]
MDEGESRTGYWLHDEQRIILYALVSLALLVGGHRTWQEYNRYHESAVRRARIMKLVESSRREKERVLEGSGLVASGSASSEIVEQVKHVVEPEVEVEKPEQLSASSSQAQQSTSSAGKRTKERRKRGRDVYKEVLKQERKRGNAPSRDSSAASASSTTLQATAIESNEDFRAQYQQPVAGPSSITSTSRSRSRSQSRATTHYDYESTEETPRISQEDWLTNRSLKDPASMSSMAESQDDSLPQQQFVEAVPSDNGNSGAVKDPCAVALPPTPPPPDLPAVSSSMSTSSESVSSRSQSAGSSPAASILQLSNDGGPSSSSSYVSESLPISQPTPAGPSIKSQAAWLEGAGNNVKSNRARTNHNKNGPPPHSASAISLATSEGSIDIESPFPSPGKYSKSKSPPPRFRSKSRTSMNSPLPTMTQIHSNAVTPPPAPANAPLHAQIASYKGALEAARKREDMSRREVERFKSECDVLRMRWKEDADRRLAIEAELRAELYFLKAQFNGMTPGVNSGSSQLPPFLPQAQHNHQQNHNGPQPIPHGSAFPLPPLFPFGYPPPMSNQSHGFPGPASPPPPPPPFAFPFVASNGVPLMHLMNGMHHSAPTSAAQSPNMLSPTHDFSNIAATAFMNGSSSSTLLDDPFQGSEDALNEELAEAILKRPESLRASIGPSSRSSSVAGRATKDGFTFASLSELGNPQAYRAKYEADESSTESSRSPDAQSSDYSQQFSESAQSETSNDGGPANDALATPRNVGDTSDK